MNTPQRTKESSIKRNNSKGGKCTESSSGWRVKESNKTINVKTHRTTADDFNKKTKEITNSLTSKMKERLAGSHFRYINEQLYSCSSSDAQAMFKDESLFLSYHHGFESQVARWPTNPLDLIIKSICTLPKSTVVADFGCGSANLASCVQHKVYSFDFVALNEKVTPCDMVNVPLADKCVDVAVFCLSLMGTNIADFLREANRVLKPRGKLKIAEIASRIVKLHPFMKTMARLGFTLDTRDTSNTMFVLFDFIKTSPPKATKFQFTLPPCVYKPR